MVIRFCLILKMIKKGLNKIKVIPNAGKNEIVGKQGQWLKIKIAAPATHGKANKELIAFFSEKCQVPKSAIKIKKGLKSRKKIVYLAL